MGVEKFYIADLGTFEPANINRQACASLSTFLAKNYIGYRYGRQYHEKMHKLLVTGGRAWFPDRS